MRISEGFVRETMNEILAELSSGSYGIPGRVRSRMEHLRECGLRLTDPRTKKVGDGVSKVTEDIQVRTGRTKESLVGGYFTHNDELLEKILISGSFHGFEQMDEKLYECFCLGTAFY